MSKPEMRAVTNSLFKLALAGACAAVVSADESAATLLKQAQQLSTRTQTLSADMELNLPDGPYRGSVRLMKPNLGWSSLKGRGGEFLLVCDGKQTYNVQPGKETYETLPAAKSGADGFGWLPGSPISLFFASEGFDKIGNAEADGTHVANGVTYHVVRITQPTPGKLYIAPSKMVEGAEFLIRNGGVEKRVSMWLKNIKLDPKLTSGDFAFQPPARFQRAKDAEELLLPVGAQAPEFRLLKPGESGSTGLAETLKNRHAVLLNFWSYNCGPCRIELPELDLIYARLKPKGLEIIAINAYDATALVQKFMKEQKLAFPVLVSPEAERPSLIKRYGVRGVPTNYLLDANGKVVWRSVGWDQAGLTEGLQRLGLQ